MSKEEAEKHLQDTLIKTYFSNLEFLKEIDNELFERVDRLSTAINNGAYEERYLLEFLQEVGEFDIYDKKENKYVYDRKPKKLINKAKNFDYSSKGTFSNLKKEACTHQKFDLKLNSDEVLDLDDSVKYIINQTSEYIDIFENKIETYSTKRYKEFSKFILIGTLLGRHFLPIRKKFKPELYFICESNLEIFRLSLFVFDYMELIKDKAAIVFSIMDDQEVFDAKLNRFLFFKAYTNHCVKFFTTDYNVTELFDSIATVFSSVNPFAYNYILSLYNILNNNSKIMGKYLRVDLKKAKNTRIDKPVIFIGAGPSLSDNIQWLYDNQDKFIIIAMAASLKKLINHKIIPDIISTVDSKEKDILKQFDFENNHKYIKDKIVLASSMASHKILEYFEPDNVFIFEVMTSFFKNSLFYSAYSIAEMTMSWLLSFDIKQIYLLGVDLALNQETGDTHISEHNDVLKLDLDNDEFFVARGGFVKTDTMEVEGNYLEKVKTTRLLLLSLKSMNNIVSVLLENQKLYNLSNQGAKIQKIEYFDPEKVKLEKFDKNIKNIKKELVNSSVKSLSQEDKLSLEKEEEFLQEFLEFMEEEELSYDGFKEYIKDFYNFVNKKIDNFVASKRFLSLYFESQLMYIDYCLNDKEIKKEERKIKEALIVMKKQVSLMLNDYLKYSRKVREIS